MKPLQQVLSFFMALAVLFVTAGWDVKFHYCTVDHELTASFGDASSSCEHCVGHHHDHHEALTTASTPAVTQFNAKCCCDDYDELIQFSDDYVFSSEKHIGFQLQPSAVTRFDHQTLACVIQQVFQHFTPRKIPNFSSGREMLVFFSSLRLNPLVF